MKHFKGESTVYQRKLLSLKCTSDLAKFQEEFTAAAAAAMPTMGEAWVKEQYLAAVQPPELALFLRSRAHEGLQVLMAAALDLEADLKRAKGHQRTGNGSLVPNTTRPMTQNPNRKQCEKCGKWKLHWEKCTQCGAAGTGKKPTERPTGRRV